jgi:hypothetical protein
MLAESTLSRLLLLNCSQRKKFDEQLLPAIERYDGPAYRVLRRYLNQNLTPSVDVRILSAKYGLISADDYLPYYDYRLTKGQAQKLHYQVITKLETILNRKSYTNLLICLGKEYLEVICDYETIIPDSLSVQVATGGIGKKLSVLYNWLYGGSSLETKQDLASTKGTGCIRGVEVTLTAEQVLDIARQALTTQDERATRYQSWYVQVDDLRVPPKWLVSQITGLPVNKFHTGSAKKLLRELGISVLFDAQI